MGWGRGIKRTALQVLADRRYLRDLVSSSPWQVLLRSPADHVPSSGYQPSTRAPGKWVNPGTMLVGQNPASLLTADWMGTCPKGGLSTTGRYECDQSDSQVFV